MPGRSVGVTSPAWRQALTLGHWRTGVQIGLGLLVATVGSSWAALAAAHANDRYRLDFVSGTWLALADYAAHGTLVPPVEQAGYYGGTRYMPLPVLLDAAASKLTGELLLSTKLVTYLVALALFALAFVVLRQVRCPPLLSLLLLAAVLVTSTGLLGTLGIRNDGLAVVFQLAAVALMLRRQSTLWVSLAGVFAALAIFSKVSAVWAAIAIAVWLIISERSRIGTFLGAFAVSLAFLAALFEFLSEGRFLSDAIEFTFAAGGGNLIDGVQALVTNFITQAEAVWLLFPFAVVAVLEGLRSRTVTLLQISLLADLVVLTVVMSARETDHNHLLDLCVLTVLVVGELAGNRARQARYELVSLLATVAVVWGVASSYQQVMGPETLGALRQLVHGGSKNPAYASNPLEGLVQPNDRILSEDPTIPLALGQRPVLLDAFIARSAFAKHPEWAAALARRIAAKEFDEIILVAGLAAGTDLYDKQFLGRTVNDAVRANYRVGYVERDIYVHVPLGRGQEQQPASS